MGLGGYVDEIDSGQGFGRSIWVERWDAVQKGNA